MVTRETWTVYRDGYRWTVGAKHLADALRRACLQTDAMTGQQYVDAGSRRELCEVLAPEGLPIALRCFTHEIEAVYCAGTAAHVVDVSDTITHATALDVLAHAREHFSAVQAAAVASTVLDADGKPVAVRLYKTGAKSNTSPRISAASPRRSTVASLSSSTAPKAPDPRRIACARRHEAYGFSLHSRRRWCSLTP